MTKAIILAAGMGTRLRPLTDNLPKCLVELAGRSLLDHQIEVLRLLGISDVHVVGGYLAEKLRRDDITLHLNHEFATTNMVYTLFRAEKELDGPEDVVVSYGDIVYEATVLERLLACEAEVCVASDKEWLRYWSARFPNPLVDAETFTVDSHGRISSLGNKPQTTAEIEGQFIGLMKFRGNSLPGIRSTWEALRDRLSSRDAETMYTTGFLQALIDNDWDVRPVFIENQWAEVDSLSDLAVAEHFFNPAGGQPEA